MKHIFKPMNFDIQNILQNDRAILLPLKEDDFDDLFKVASDPKIWEQHPNKDRWKKEVFQVFFEGALQSNGAYKIVEKATGKTIGCTSFYDYEENERSIFIGYTFYAVEQWGKGINAMVKQTMLDYIFQFIDKVKFQVGASNVRSQIAITRIGATKIDEQEVAYFGEDAKLNYIYCIKKAHTETIKISEIKSAQASFYKSFLMKGLIDDEDNFRISPNDELIEPFPTTDKDDSFTLGAFFGNTLCGVVSFERDGKNREKLKHKGILFRMYVSNDYRGKGISKMLIQELLNKVTSLKDIERINLTVIENNEIAKKIYEKIGFTTFAIEQNAIKWKGKYFNELQMVYKLFTK